MGIIEDTGISNHVGKLCDYLAHAAIGALLFWLLYFIANIVAGINDPKPNKDCIYVCIKINF